MKLHPNKHNKESRKLIFDLLMKGCTYDEIVQISKLPYGNVKYYVKRLMLESGVNSTNKLMAIEIERLQEEVETLRRAA